MPRTRISTTVDADKLDRARELFGEKDAAIFDKALAALLDAEETRREIEALKRFPYREDPDLYIPLPPATDDLPYEGDVPPEVLALAEARRKARAPR